MANEYYIYRDFHLQPTKDKSVKFLQAVSISKCCIICCWSLDNGFPESQANKHEIFFKLRFINQARLDTFHSFGFDTTEPAEVGF